MEQGEIVNINTSKTPVEAFTRLNTFFEGVKSNLNEEAGILSVVWDEDVMATADAIVGMQEDKSLEWAILIALKLSDVLKECRKQLENNTPEFIQELENKEKYCNEVNESIVEWHNAREQRIEHVSTSTILSENISFENINISRFSTSTIGSLNSDTSVMSEEISSIQNSETSCDNRNSTRLSLVK